MLCVEFSKWHAHPKRHLHCCMVDVPRGWENPERNPHCGVGDWEMLHICIYMYIYIIIFNHNYIYIYHVNRSLAKPQCNAQFVNTNFICFYAILFLWKPRGLRVLLYQLPFDAPMISSWYSPKKMVGFVPRCLDEPNVTSAFSLLLLLLPPCLCWGT